MTSGRISKPIRFFWCVMLAAAMASCTVAFAQTGQSPAATAQSSSSSSASTSASASVSTSASASVSASADPQASALFASWNGDAPALAELRSYVEDVTDKTSADFIPVEDRIAVFDLDGTLYCETDPTYFTYMMFVHRALDDDSYDAPDDVKSVAQEVLDGVEAGSFPEDLELREAKAEAVAFAGMTLDEYTQYVLDFMSTPAAGFTGLTRGEAFYKPMLEVIDYLQENDFTVYIVSGTDRFEVRTLIAGTLDIPEEHVIGMDVSIVASGQGDKDGLDYVYDPSTDVPLRGDTLIIKNVKMNKVSQIVQEIGRQPVLAFGNSTGDTSMLEYTIDDNPYKAESFLLINDDTVREHGNLDKAAKLESLAKEDGWNTISMANEFATIYGDGVEAESTSSR